MGQLTTFSVPIKKELDNGKSIKYKIKFINTFRFMSKSLSSLAKYLSERIHSNNCADCKFHLDYMSVKDNQLLFRCFECKKIIRKTFLKSYLEDLQIHMNFVMEILINLF